VRDDPFPFRPAPPGALDEAEEPDPGFWGPGEAPRRRRRPADRGDRPPSVAERRIALAMVAVVAVTAGVLSLRSSARPAAPSSPPTRTAAVTARSRRVVVHVAGAVTRPGVVELPAGSRVIDALDAAGGAVGPADLDRLNLAAPLRDGEQVLVPLTGSPATAGAPPAATP
jgi:competence protein ComEA